MIKLMSKIKRKNKPLKNVWVVRAEGDELDSLLVGIATSARHARRLKREHDMSYQSLFPGCLEYSISVYQTDTILSGVKTDNETEKLIREVEKLYNNTPEGTVFDSDTILADMVETCDYEISGLSKEIFSLWKDSIDKRSIECMFYEFTGVQFSEYLKKCIDHTTK